MGFAQMPEGTSPEAFAEEMKSVTKVALENPYVDYFTTVESFPTDNQGMLFYTLTDPSKRPDIWKVMEGLNASNYEHCIGTQTLLKSMPLINLQVGNVTAGKANYQYIFRSFDEEAVNAAAEKIMTKMRASSYFKDVSTDYQPNAPVIHVDFLRNQANSYGNVKAANIEDSIKYAYGETYISKINVPQNMYYVIMDMEKQFNTSPQNFSSLYLANNTQGKMVALNSVIDDSYATGSELSTRINALPAVTIAFNPGEGKALSTVLAKMEEIIAENLPSNVSKTAAGNTAAFASAITQFVLLIALAIFVVYIILGILYENFLHPLTAISNIPVALLGGILSLIATGNTISIYALIGLLMLLGIVMKNGILIIDFTLELMEQENLSARDAIFKACTLRFRPIVMTTIAAMMGAVPIAVGIGGTVAKSRAPLGIAIVGGLIFAQIVTLFVTPVIFLYVHKLNHFFTTKTKLFGSSQ